MRVETKSLLTISHYAKKAKVARQTVYNKIQQGELDTITIDGITFIKLKKAA